MKNEMNKIKKILSGGVVILLIAFFGLAPIERQVAFALDWGDMGMKMMAVGVVDKDKMEGLHLGRGGMTASGRAMMYGNSNENFTITPENSDMALHMLWAFGLANKNEILEKGPMMDPKYGDAGRFASTGGYTLGKGGAMEHYSMHSFVELTAAEQKLVEKTAKNIFRPCCKNSAYFPDCNHGMAMLGLLELMASQGASEKEMYKAALEANALWFPEVKTSCGA
ncbi:hypothetical protein A3I95_02815 [Candidatus Nomurabacteria bacterium RIFCSPLOWO2_02_FULL_44_12]|uniref:Uncharacterized protein n=1 Tax=Candidatus Nomurabacteria bacterium RIFCSPLOWO2_12_FULL_44_11 TaxID=1801796 RepID=A0A1F6Y7P3_9BACT|nr:MAG: hypothetical protein A3E95_02515 [Candidatus Nomurabacteria bacterium RIFCSPHIGHO2_12_FULL_44_22b]OGJ02404.1 MAG: hypothetical protein A3G53_00845 [Candidatus Nomurabacteria bacterium RIFCSPLOWO2_12_FULL_44_11]OGJ08654.1 MAG: hypothetical protein A3I95_02815 [Candidatus Nomurabacteria bacterium RIFCSPLOWO2_02_FULL_44_12]